MAPPPLVSQGSAACGPQNVPPGSVGRPGWPIARPALRPHVAVPNCIAMTGMCDVCVICVSLSACLSLKFRNSYYTTLLISINNLLIISFYCPGGSMWLRAAPLTKASPLVVVGNQNIVDKKTLRVSLGELRSRTQKKSGSASPPPKRKLACSLEKHLQPSLPAGLSEKCKEPNPLETMIDHVGNM